MAMPLNTDESPNATQAGNFPPRSKAERRSAALATINALFREYALPQLSSYMSFNKTLKRFVGRGIATRQLPR